MTRSDAENGIGRTVLVKSGNIRASLRSVFRDADVALVVHFPQDVSYSRYFGKYRLSDLSFTSGEQHGGS